MGEWKDGCSADYTHDGYRLRTGSGSCQRGPLDVGLVLQLRIEFTVRWQKTGASGAWTGLAFRTPSADYSLPWITFAINSDGQYSITQIYAPGNKALKTKKGVTNPAIQTGEEARNRLVVEIRGGTVNYYVNDALLDSHKLPFQPYVYLWFNLDGADAEVVFEHLRVLRLGEPSAGN
jgi:hypothetical protein